MRGIMTGVHKTEAAAGKSELAAHSSGGRPETGLSQFDEASHKS